MHGESRDGSASPISEIDMSFSSIKASGGKVASTAVPNFTLFTRPSGFPLLAACLSRSTKEDGQAVLRGNSEGDFPGSAGGGGSGLSVVKTDERPLNSVSVF